MVLRRTLGLECDLNRGPVFGEARIGGLSLEGFGQYDQVRDPARVLPRSSLTVPPLPSCSRCTPAVLWTTQWTCSTKRTVPESTR